MSKRNTGDSVVVVAGFSRSHLLSTIGLLYSIGVKVFGVSAIAPEPKFLSRFGVNLFHTNRFTYRRQLMGDAPVKQVRFAEIPYQLAVRISNPARSSVYSFLAASSFKLFSKNAYRYSRRIDRENNASLLIRSGFGSAFNSDSRKFISDASLPHPNVLQSLIHTGEMKFEPIDHKDVISKLILNDTSKADVILVNSDFVKETFVFAGVPESKIFVAYLPPTGIFQSKIETPKKIFKTGNENLKILFAGTLEERKGINEIISVAESALDLSLKYEFNFIGNWGKDSKQMEEKMTRLANCRIEKWKSQIELAKVMEESDVFLFPSRAEGGARVVTEAMCIGMPIITTHNSGSPIKHLQEGIIVKPMDSDAILQWLLELSLNEPLFLSLASQSRKRIETLVTEGSYLEIVRRICNV
jgi:glycosyltransferase involved in cell wall biosynthesis